MLLTQPIQLVKFLTQLNQANPIPILWSIVLIKSDFALTIHWQHYNEMFAFHGYLYKSQLQSQSFCVYNLQYA